MAPPQDEVQSVRRLEGWMTFHEAGIDLGMSKQGFHKLVFESAARPINVDRDVRAVGTRPDLLVRTTAVAAEKRRREVLAQEKENPPPVQTVTRTRKRAARD